MNAVTVPAARGPRVGSRAFLVAVAARFGRLDFDLACTLSNTKAPDSFASRARVDGSTSDSLARDWNAELDGVTCWINPPFARIAPWARKCRETIPPEMLRNAHGWRGPKRILLLTPASIGSNWFADYVYGAARVYALRPRLAFVGAPFAFPKDLMLSVYGESPGFGCWRWA